MTTDRTPAARVPTLELQQQRGPECASGVDDREFDSDALLLGRKEVLIRHGDEVYRLRRTRSDKLILTK